MDSAPHPRPEWVGREGPADLRVSPRECRRDRRQVRDPVETARREEVLTAREARRAEDSADQEVVREVAVQEVPAALEAGAAPVVRAAEAPEAATARAAGEDPAGGRNGWGLAG